MRRNQKNFDLLWYASDLAGSVFRSSWCKHRFFFPKDLSKENRNFLRSLGWRQQIRSVGIALKEAGSSSRTNLAKDTLCLQFTVEKKLPTGRIPTEFRIPKYIPLHHLGARILTDVIDQEGQPIAQSTAGGGRLAAQNLGGAGTVTAIVVDQQLRPFALGCAHVLAPPALAVREAPVESPPDRNTSSLNNVIGGLFGWTTLIPGGSQDLDAALVAIPANQVAIVTTLPDGSSFGPVVTKSDELRAQIGMFRGTVGGWAGGTLLQINVTRSIPFPGIGEIIFSGLLKSALPNAAGDSGSPVVLANGLRALSMHIAGDNVNTTWSVPLVNVLSKLRVRLA